MVQCCDRCLKPVDRPQVIECSITILASSVREKPLKTGGKVELCFDCFTFLDNWLDELKKKPNVVDGPNASLGPRPSI